MRQWIVASCLVAGAANAQGLTNAPAKAPQVPFTETRFGQTVDDPFRWMEDPKRKSALMAYIKSQSDTATAELRALPNRAAWAALIDAAARAGTRTGDVRVAGGYSFWRQQDATDRTPKLMVRSAIGTRVLYDPARENGDPAGPAAINSYSVSPDGRTVALHVSYGGAEIAAIRFLDSDTGRETLSRVAPTWGEFRIVWLDGGKVVFTRMGEKRPGEDEMLGMTALVGTPGDSFTPVLGPDVAGGPAFDRAAFPLVTASPASDWLTARPANAGSDPIVYAARRADIAAGKPAWHQVAAPADKVVGVTALRGDAYVISMGTASDGQLVRVSLTDGRRTVVATPTGYVLSNVAATSDSVFVVGQRDGVSHLFRIGGGREPAKELPLPFEAGLTGLEPTGDASAVTITLAGWTTAPKSYLVRGEQLSSLGIDSVSWPEAGNLSVQRASARSADGTEVPMVIIDRPADKPHQALIEAYGSYGVSNTTPWYNPYYLAWSARGNAMVYCGTRGGGERGRAWTDGGRGRNKPNAQADLIACAERLVELGIARPKNIGVTGTSAGGLLVPMAAEKRPDLFGALLSRVAVLNATRLESADNGQNQFKETGDPRTAEGWRALAAQDAYLGLGAAHDLPDTLLTIGLNDHRVPPWMSAKFAARAQQQFGDKRLVLIRAEGEGGHGMGSARDLQVAEFADSFAFLETRLGR